MFLKLGQTALHKAALSGHVDVIDRILDHSPAIITKTDNVSKWILMHKFGNKSTKSQTVWIFEKEMGYVTAMKVKKQVGNLIANYCI